jgi:hypothetical protein
MKKPELCFIFEATSEEELIQKLDGLWAVHFSNYPGARDRAFKDFFFGRITRVEALDRIIRSCVWIGAELRQKPEKGKTRGKKLGYLERYLVLEEGSTTRWEVRERERRY